MKKRTYAITLFAYMTVHVLRMTPSFTQADIQKFYEIDNTFMGIISSLMYIAIGFGYLFLLFFPIEKVLLRYFLNMGISAFTYLLVSITGYLQIHSKYLLMVCFIVCGFSQSVAYPVVMKLIYQHYNSKDNGLALGFWSSSGDFGNIFSFFVNTILVYTLGLSWESCFLFASLVTVFMAIIMQTCLKDENQSQIHHYEFSQVLQILKIYFKNVEYCILLITICLLKGTLYGILLWLPMYFQDANFKQFEGLIPIAFSFCSILGSGAFGSCYMCIHQRFIRALITIFVLILIVGELYFLKTLTLEQSQKWKYLFLIGIIGFCLDGTFNSLISIESSIVGQESRIKVDIISTIMMTASCIVVGITQLIIGISTTNNSQAIFIIFVCFAFSAFVLQIIRSIVLFYRRQQNLTTNQLGSGFQLIRTD